MKCYGVIAARNPDPAVLYHAISSIYRDVSGIFLIDNASLNYNEYLSKISQLQCDITIIHNPQNVGLTVQLNQGIAECIRIGADVVFILTQDTIMPTEGLRKLLKFYNDNSQLNIGVLGAKCIVNVKQIDSSPAKEYSKVKMLMSTAILVPVSTFKTVGEYREDFFIYYEDDEFCHRVRKSGKSIVQLNTVQAKHSEGDARVTIFNPFRLKFVSSTARKPNMIYYIARNGIYFSMYECHSFLPISCNTLLKNIHSCIRYYKNPVATLRFALLGLKDGIFRKLGKCHKATP